MIETLLPSGITLRQRENGGVIDAYCVKVPLGKSGRPAFTPGGTKAEGWWWVLCDGGAWLCFRSEAAAQLAQKALLG